MIGAYRLLALLGVAGGLFAGGAWIGWSKRGDVEAGLQAVANAKAEKKLQKTEDDWRAAVYDIAYTLETERIARERETSTVISDLRSGAVKLRPRFTCPKLPQVPRTAGPADDREESGLRITDAEFLIRLADECDTVTDERNAGKAYAETVRKAP